MKTPAKTNLYLRVTGELSADGRHEIETVFVPVHHLHDEVELLRTDTPGAAMEIAGPGAEFLSADPSNLCLKALHAFCADAGIPAENFLIRLKKNIPVAAGLGGGSSDAAAVLLLLEKEFPGRANLPELARTLGADVAFFLNPVPSLARGIGEILEPLPEIPDDLPLEIISFSFPVSAKWAYQQWDKRTGMKPEPGARAEQLIEALAERNFELAGHYLRNDLEESVFRKFPVLRLKQQELLNAGARRVMLSGSGSSIFAWTPGK